MLPLLPACQGDNLNRTKPIEPAALYWNLELNHHAVTLSMTSPYDTLTLTAVPRNSAGEPLSGLPAPVYRSADPERVVVTAEGTLVAAQVTSDPVAVIATLTTDNLKHVDTVLVRVVADAAPPVLGTFSIQPVPPDSAKVAMALGATGFAYLLNRLVRVADPGGAPLGTVSVDFDPLNIFPVPVPIADLLVSFRSSDPTVAVITHSSSGGGTAIFQLVGLRPGAVTLTASTTAFGITKADTLAFRIGVPILNLVPQEIDTLANGSLVPTLPNTVVLGVGGAVLWVGSGHPVEITFSDPTNVTAAINAASYFSTVCFFDASCTDAGNIPAFAGSFIFRGRVFSLPGTYEYRSTAQGSTESASGRIVVIDEQ